MLALLVASCRDVANKVKWLLSTCTPEDSGKCGDDGKTFYKCKSGHFELSAQCKGDNGCYHDGSLIRCDESKANVGDACGVDGHACSLDGKIELVCKNGLYSESATCPGPNGCVVVGKTISCDGKEMKIGAPCTGSNGVCGEGHTTRLKCQSGELVLDQDCRGPKGCYSGDDRKLHCDQSVTF